MRFYLGCAVWAYKDWGGELFPPGSRSADFLRLYSRRLSTVEGNTTFYAVPRPDVVARWAAETPAGFRFCFKLPREVSHEGPLDAQLEPTRAFVERMAPLGERLGPFFLQLPPGYSADRLADLERWLQGWPGGHRVAVEVRHADWYAAPGEAALMALLERYGAGRVLMDVRPLGAGPLPGAEDDLQRARDNKPDVPLHPLHSGGLALVRYIGHPDLALNGPFLDEWAGRVAAWLAEGTTVYFFCHCPDERLSPRICRTFHARLARLVELPPLGWGADEPPPEQLSMF
ncbi:MAG TPA: DUF72 domain-containing protein [Chloroflexaceae bacterium]|nr:DUF72 domain-containing protein [Chloroflexaceae bacterium]